MVMPLPRLVKRRRYYLGEIVPQSALYCCTACAVRIHWPQGLVFEACPMCEELGGVAAWVPVRRKHINVPIELKARGMALAAIEPNAWRS